MMADLLLGSGAVSALRLSVALGKYSGAIYDGSNATASAVLHISILAVTGLILFLWPALFKKNEDGHKNRK